MLLPLMGSWDTVLLDTSSRGNFDAGLNSMVHRPRGFWTLTFEK